MQEETTKDKMRGADALRYYREIEIISARLEVEPPLGDLPASELGWVEVKASEPVTSDVPEKQAVRLLVCARPGAGDKKGTAMAVELSAGGIKLAPNGFRARHPIAFHSTQRPYGLLMQAVSGLLCNHNCSIRVASTLEPFAVPDLRNARIAVAHCEPQFGRVDNLPFAVVVQSEFTLLPRMDHAGRPTGHVTLYTLTRMDLLKTAYLIVPSGSHQWQPIWAEDRWLCDWPPVLRDQLTCRPGSLPEGAMGAGALQTIDLATILRSALGVTAVFF